MNRYRELLKRSLDDLESHGYGLHIMIKKEIKEELAKPESESEHVAWMYDLYLNDGSILKQCFYHKSNNPLLFNEIPLYISPPKRDPLSIEEIMKIIVDNYGHTSREDSIIRVVMEVEKAHGIGI